MSTRSLLLKLTAFVLLVQSTPLFAQGKRAITVEDYFTQADLFQVAIGLNGLGDGIRQLQVAYTEGRWQKSTDDRKTDLWTTFSGGRPAAYRRTFDRASYRSPQLSTEYLYVLANRKREGEKKAPFNGSAQVWRLAPGEMVAVTQLEGGVEAYELSHNGFLLYLVHVQHQEVEWNDLRQKFPNVEYGQGVHKTSQIWKLNLANFRTEKLIDAGRYIYEFALSRDSNRLAMITAPDETVVSFEGKSRIDVWEAGKITTLRDEVWRKSAPSPYAWLERLAWSEDGKMLAFGCIFDGYPAEIIISSFADETPASFRMPRPEGVHVRGYGSPIEWNNDDLYFLGEEKARVRLMRASSLGVGTKPKFATLTPGDVVVENFSKVVLSNSIPQEFNVAVVLADSKNLPDIYMIQIDETNKFKMTRLTKVNPQADNWKLPQMKTVSWKGARGDTVEGVLELPPDYEPGTKIPLVVEIHGGPTTATYLKMQYWIYGRTLLPARGYAVLCPNYRGSTGYGDKFTTDLIGHENDIDVEDILKGVDSLVDAGIADPNRLAVSGWSNGGYLTNCLIAKTTRFKAAISGAGIVDAIMEFGGNDEPAYSIVFKQGFPWSNSEKYHKASSTYSLDKIRTPTLIHVGGNDDRCPPSQSRLLFRALKEYLNVPTQLMVYPGEPHGLSKYSNRQAKMEWDLAWLDRYVLGKK